MSEPADDAWRWPIRGEILRRFDPHREGPKGLDIAGEAGSAIRAAAPGRVVYSGDSLPGYGPLVIVKHAGDLFTAYAYLQQRLVEDQEQVSAGQVIGRMGTGGTYRRPVLHFEIRRGGDPADPEAYLPG